MAMMDIQALVDSMGASDRRTRANYHLTLGGLLARLREFKPEAVIAFDFNGESPSKADSYRGYYADLAISSSAKPTRADEFLAQMEAALDTTYTGYKGGDFVMDAVTPLWYGTYGTTSGSRAILSLTDEGILVTKELDGW
jgi:hypothetical protein